MIIKKFKLIRHLDLLDNFRIPFVQLYFIITFLFSQLFAQIDSPGFIMGADVSFIPQIEDLGGVYTSNNMPMDPLYIFKVNGVNYIRLKLWHTPTQNYDNLEKILAMAQRIKEQKLHFLLDFHYSDTWADPGHQSKPSAWQGISFETLKDSVYQYTKYVMQFLFEQQTFPHMVQIGNEITSGILWDDGRVGGNFENPKQWRQLGELINAAIRGVRESCDLGHSVKILIHLDRGGDNSACRWFFDNLINQDVYFDVIGLSFYPWWHGTLNTLKANLNDLSVRYEKDLVVVETAYPWTLQWFDSHNNIVGSSKDLHNGYPASIDGQMDFLRDLMGIIQNTRNGKGKGLFYWAPEYISVQPLGSPWENMTLFDFQGNALHSLQVFSEKEPSSIGSKLQNLELDFVLHQNFPNPFNHQTRISYELNRPEHVRLSIYNLQGQLITELIDQDQPGGHHTIVWSGTDLVSGMYIVRLETDAGTVTKKTLLLK